MGQWIQAMDRSRVDVGANRVQGLGKDRRRVDRSGMGLVEYRKNSGNGLGRQVKRN